MFPFSLYVGPEKMLGKKKRSEEGKKWKKNLIIPVQNISFTSSNYKKKIII